MFELLVRDADPIELTEIRRFTHVWERAASARLRAGDPHVVAVYDAHGRIRGGTEQEMVAAAVRGYLADVLEARRSLLIVRAEAMATELSAQIRAELVAAGRVSAEVLAQTKDGNLVGDLIQARRNDYSLRVHGSRPVTNREVYEVIGHNRLTGTLTVPPAWALAASTLGAPPAGPMQRAEWVRRAGIVAAYRDLHAIPGTQLSIGEAPSRERAFHHALWRQALTALGHPADALDYATASDAELRELRAAWRRVEAAPEFVAEDLYAARVEAEDYRRDAVIWRAGLDRNPVGSAEREVDERDLAAAEQLAAVSAARVEALERIQHVRTEWLDRHSDLHERHTFAGDELERRRLDRDAVATPGEQQELFTMRDGSHDTESHSGGGAASTSGADARSPAPAQQQLGLDGMPRANPSNATREQTDRTTATGPAGTDGSTRAAATTARAAAAAAADPADTESDGYAEVFARAERTDEQERQQPGLFDAQPADADVAAAQPVHEDDPAGGRRHSDTAQRSNEDESATEEAAVTVGQAARGAEIIAELRGELDARAAAAVAPQRRGTEPDDADTDVAPAPEEATESRTDATQGHGLST
jgi:hypothetical protein